MTMECFSTTGDIQISEKTEQFKDQQFRLCLKSMHLKGR